MIKELNMFDEYGAPEDKKEIKRRVTLYDIKLVKEKSVNYTTGIGQKVDAPEKVHKIAIEGIEIHLQTTENNFGHLCPLIADPAT